MLFFGMGLSNKEYVLEFKKASSISYFYEHKENKLPKKSIPKAIAKKDTLQDLDTSKLNQPGLKGISHYRINNTETENGVERVLLIGDSQLEGLSKPVTKYCQNNNHAHIGTVIWYGSSTKQWATTDTLQYFLDKFKPTVVLFAIGLNELFVRDLDKRAKYIQEIKNVFNEYGVRYSWIGPAAWTEDKGIISVMKKEVGQHFYPSHLLKLDRASDGRHPSRNASKIWFDEVATSITEIGTIDFSNKKDTVSNSKRARTIILSVPKA